MSFEGKVKGNLLNRIIRRTEAGYEMEGDQRHAEIIVRDLGLTEESKALSAPGRKPTKAELDGEHESLSQEDHSDYRARVARCNFMSSDRLDISYTVKELCRRMSGPDAGDQAALKRLGCYVLDRQGARHHLFSLAGGGAPHGHDGQRLGRAPQDCQVHERRLRHEGHAPDQALARHSGDGCLV